MSDDNIMAMSLQQLSQMRENSRKELAENEARYQSMATALGKYQDSLRSINMISQSEEEQKMLVPMTQSLFIPGKLANTTHVTLEIGTGFFVKRTIPDAQAFCERKITKLKSFTERVGESIMAQAANLRQIEQVMQAKVAQIKSEQDGAK
eukprot:CAMPEP_0184511544 /NCGR_PEP_ID=MMETSP0198_2-20121128/2408_1 /TAXON_ID=1112570 /ORGANISM="Thraustochytrium sp., Strain LLF1b" /LENGTH=149 /DNA_ID=CAMNT_0026901517 /DNA_START=50 /DNA_END=499 /DNA_ORIENTATION=+